MQEKFGSTSGKIEKQIPLVEATNTIEPLVKKVMEGDEEAFTELYNQYNRKVKGVCLDIVKNDAVAEELTQEVFIKVFKNIKSFKGDSKFSTWLHRVAVNESRMYLRSSKQASQREFSIEPEKLNLLADFITSQNNNGENNTIEKIASKRDTEELMAALEKLNPELKKTVLLRLKDLTNKEIAKMLGITTVGVRSRLFRAKEELFKIMG